MKASYYKNLLMVLMCLCLTGVHGEEHEWTNIQGQTIKAEFVSATNEAVIISMRRKNFEVKFTNLLPQSVALAKRLQRVVKEGLQVKNEDQVLGKAYSISNLNMDMLWCKPGTFMMGSPKDEKDRDENETQHKVTLTKGFWFGKHEVTIGQFRKFVESTGYRTDAERKVPFKGGDNTYTGIVNLDFEAGKIVDDRSSTWATLFASSEANPVLGVSWNDTVAFCNWLTDAEGKAGRLPVGYTYSLPAEAQWEYACRAGTTTATSFGDSLSSRQANFHGNYPYGNAAKDRWLKKTAKVGSYPANAWGFHDMHGNVWEWCSDWYGEYPNGQVSDPVGPSDGSKRVSRGGGWLNDGRFLRSAIRDGYAPGTRNGILGFRLSLQTEKKERSDP
jgi:formylglycine-generating enzyme required for sulfatase activity